ncbi:hypothetical protein D9M69_526300 [compost metagenome]
MLRPAPATTLKVRALGSISIAASPFSNSSPSAWSSEATRRMLVRVFKVTSIWSDHAIARCSPAAVRQSARHSLAVGHNPKGE